MRSVLDRLRLGFSLLCEYKFRHNCEETLNPLCPCNIQSETMHFFFFLRCNFYIVIWANLMSDLLNIDTPFVDKMM